MPAAIRSAQRLALLRASQPGTRGARVCVTRRQAREPRHRLDNAVNIFLYSFEYPLVVPQRNLKLAAAST